jgi:hypothetical protein
MNTIVSKIQYKNCEPGEFKEEKVRTLNDSIQLIKDFPWAAQRTGNPVGLTNPSLTFQDNDSNFLKLAPSYNGRFILYYFKKDKCLYSRKGIELEEALKTIEQFYQESSFDYSPFVREQHPFKHLQKHFVTKHFRYEAKGMFYFLQNFIYSDFSQFFIIVIPSSVIATLQAGGEVPIVKGLICLIIIFIIICIGRLYFYSSAKGKVLILSKGSDEFQFGDKKSLITFNKKDIASITIPGPKKGWGLENHIYKISFKDEGYLYIPDILLPSTKFTNKFPGIKLNYQNYRD